MADEIFTIKRGDTSPAIECVLLDSAGAAVELTGIQAIRFIMRTVASALNGNAGAPKVNAAAEVTDAAAGEVRYQWITADTDTIGTFYGEWEVTFGSGRKETFPNSKHLEILVKGDLG